MRLTLVAPHMPPTFVGGVELYVQRLSHWLAANGHDARVVAVESLDARDGPVDASVTREGSLETIRLAVPSAEPSQAVRHAYHGAELERWWTQHLATARPDVLHLHSGYLQGGAVLAAAAHHRVPVVVTLHDYWFICPRITLLTPSGDRCTGPERPEKCAWCLATVQRRFRVPDAWSGRWLSRMVPQYLNTAPGVPPRLRQLRDALAERQTRLIQQLNQVDAVLGPSQFVLAKHREFGLEASHTRYHRQGITPRLRVPRVPGPPGHLAVGYLGQIAPHKGIHVLLDALSHLPGASVSVHVFGDLTRSPEYVERLRRLARADARIHLEGLISQDQLGEAFARLDVLVVPSVWDENAPFVIHEAQRAGVAVVATRLGGMPEMIDDGCTGLLVEPGDSAALAAALGRLRDEAGLLERLRAAQPTAVRSIADEFGELLDLYRQVAQRAEVPRESPA